MKKKKFLSPRAEAFWEKRSRQNKIVFEYADKNIKRFFNLDGAVYQDGALPSKFKEMLGLVASLVLRCEDCIAYHTIRCYEEGVSDEELTEVLSIALVVGGSIVIPHLRGCMEMWDELKMENGTDLSENAGTG